MVGAGDLEIDSYQVTMTSSTKKMSPSDMNPTMKIMMISKIRMFSTTTTTNTKAKIMMI